MSSHDKPKTQTISFGKIANHANLRCDAKYRLFWGEMGDTLYPDSCVPCFPMKLATVDHRIEKLKKGELDSEYELIELEDVEARTGNIVTSTMVTNIKSDKLLFGDADVLTTRLRPYLGKTIVNDRSRQMAGTTEWIPIKVRPDRLHPLLLKYYLLSSVYIDNAARLLSGKEHPRVAESDFLSLKCRSSTRRRRRSWCPASRNWKRTSRPSGKRSNPTSCS
jgi:type I restriction enzyme, S subunit